MSSTTKRDYFAGLAMQGILSCAIVDHRNGYLSQEGRLMLSVIAEDAFKLADEMMKVKQTNIQRD
jgi:hypothetical protein